MSKHHSSGALFIPWLWFAVRVFNIFKVLELLLVGARIVTPDTVVLLLRELAHMLPDGVHGGDGVKLGVDTDIVFLVHVGLGENFHNILTVHGFDS